jgi:hypothetical protein
MTKYYMNSDHFDRSCVKFKKFLRTKLEDMLLSDTLPEFFPYLR